jgi:peptidoglycan/LPS O-acetylase OafA/YrhL
MIRKQPLPSLTGLRFLAALWVVLYHVFATWRPQLLPRAHPIDPPIWQLLERSAVGVAILGFSGVSLFFLLSGFILTYVYADDWASLSPRAFWVARLARLYPTYAVASVLALAPYIWSPDPLSRPIPTVPLVASLLQAWYPPSALAWNPPAWSLSVEAFFYLLFPFVLPLLQRLNIPRLLILALGMYVASVLVPAVYIGSGLYLKTGPEGVLLLRVVTDFPLARSPEFILGMAVGRIFILRQTRASTRGRGLRDRGLASGGEMVVVACIVVAVVLGSHIPVFGALAVTLAPAFIALIYLLGCGGGLLSWILARPPVVALGEASYALYLIHEPLWHIADRALAPAPRGAGFLTLMYCAAFIVLACALAMAIHVWIERPARTAIRRMLLEPGPPQLSRLQEPRNA